MRENGENNYNVSSTTLFLLEKLTLRHKFSDAKINMEAKKY